MLDVCRDPLLAEPEELAESCGRLGHELLLTEPELPEAEPGDLGGDSILIEPEVAEPERGGLGTARRPGELRPAKLGGSLTNVCTA